MTPQEMIAFCRQREQSMRAVAESWEPQAWGADEDFAAVRLSECVAKADAYAAIARYIEDKEGTR